LWVIHHRESRGDKLTLPRVKDAEGRTDLAPVTERLFSVLASQNKTSFMDVLFRPPVKEGRRGPV
jgi:hypothetical protein